MDYQEGLSIDENTKCKATLSIGIMIAEPLKNGNWRPIHVNNDSITLSLDGYNIQDLMAQVYDKIKEFKEKWPNQIVI